MSSRKLTEVHFYQGVKFGGSVIKYITLDEYHSDKTLCRGHIAELGDYGVTVSNTKSGECVMVPYNNVAYVRYEAQKPVIESKKAK